MDKTSVKSTLIALAHGRLRLIDPAPPASDHPPASTAVGQSEQGRVFYEPEHHSFLELIGGLTGHAAVYTPGGWSQFEPGTVWAFLPGAVHSERYIAPSRPYRMLWVVVSRLSVGFHITAYQPGRGYRLVGKRLALQLPWRQELLALAVRPDLSRDPVLQIRFQTHLMTILDTALSYMDKRSNRDCGELQVPYHHQVVDQVRHYLDQHYQEDISLRAVAQMVRYSSCHLNLLFRRQIGMPVRQYLLGQRLARARHLIKTTDLAIKQVAYAVGFRDPLYFSRLFRRHYGSAPSRQK